MKTLTKGCSALALILALAFPVAAQQMPPRGTDVLVHPDFVAATEGFAFDERLEIAIQLNMALRQYERAIPMLEALLKQSPGRAELWATLAVACNQLDEARDALDAADIAITLAPHVPHYFIERGIAAFRLGEHERSIADLKHFLESFPVNARAHYYLGLAQAAQGDVKAARGNLLRARALNPALALLTEYYLALIEAGEGRIALSQQLLAETRRAFEDTDSPDLRALIARQSTEMDQRVNRTLRSAMHESDARHASLPETAGTR